MAEKALFFDAVDGDRVYHASDFLKLIRGTVYKDGISPGVDNELRTAFGSGMSILVGTGMAFLKGFCYINDTNSVVLAVPAADSTNPRIDRVVVKLDQYISARTINVYIKAGTPSETPEAPSLQRDAYVYEISLASYTVGAGAIAPSNLTDERTNEEVCGYLYVSQTTPGPMSAADKVKLDGILPVTETVDGLMAATDKVRIDNFFSNVFDNVKGLDYIMLLHTNQDEITTETDYHLMYDSSFIVDFDRHSSNIRFGIVESGNGNAKVEISDGTNSISVELLNKNYSQPNKQIIDIDCSALQSGTNWDLHISGKAVSDQYMISRVNIQALAVDQFSGQTLTLANPGLDFTQTSWVLLDTKAFPINYLIDYSCYIKCWAKVTLGNGVNSVNLKFRLTNQNGADSSFEEGIIQFTSTGLANIVVPTPVVVAPNVRVDIYGQLPNDGGTATLEHYELWLET